MPLKSKSKADRFSSWKLFSGHLEENGFSKEIISLAKKLHDKIIKEISLHGKFIDYTVNHDISFKRPSPVKGEKKVFAYIQINKKTISLFLLSHGGKKPEGENIRINPRDKTEYIITLQPNHPFPPREIDPIRFSYNCIITGKKQKAAA